jgi:Zn-dependent protease
VGFLLHELAHRIVARGYGAEAHFIANNAWLVLSVIVAFGGIFIAAPGAVWHRGTRTLQQGGIIAAAGPLTNIALALLFLAASSVVPAGLPSAICQVGYNINAFLALFNMIPFGPFDGKKVWDWNKVVWGVIIGVAAIMTYLLPRYL